MLAHSAVNTCVSKEQCFFTSHNKKYLANTINVADLGGFLIFKVSSPVAKRVSACVYILYLEWRGTAVWSDSGSERVSCCGWYVRRASLSHAPSQSLGHFLWFHLRGERGERGRERGRGRERERVREREKRKFIRRHNEIPESPETFTQYIPKTLSKIRCTTSGKCWGAFRAGLGIQFKSK